MPLAFQNHECRIDPRSFEGRIQNLRLTDRYNVVLVTMQDQEGWRITIWNRLRYAKKQVRPIFIEEPNQIVVVTVYVYYY